MHAFLALLSVALADSRLFLAPTGYTPQMAQPQEALAYGPAAGPYVQISESAFPAEPVLPLQVAYPSTAEQEAPAASSSVVYAAGAILLAGAGAMAASRKETAVAEPDLEAAESAATVAMLFSSGAKAGAKKPAPKRKPAPKKAAAPKRAVKAAPKRPVARKTGTGKGSGFVGSDKQSPAERFAKNLFSKENWAYQAFSILSELPSKSGTDKAKNTNDIGVR